jgi:3-hydroxyacyl-CoA dehydrogenase
MPAVSAHRDGEVLVIVIDNPPVNALGALVRAELLRLVEEARSDPGVAALVIGGGGASFSAGADITEFGKSPAAPSLPALAEAIEQYGEPVVAAIRGNALGGGLEIALACHYRVAAPSAKLGLPEVKLGILPGAGGTQRLPRVVGAQKALEMIVSGDPIGATAAHDAGLVDMLTGEASLEADAVAFAREVAGRSQPPITSQRRDRIEGTDPALFDHFRKDNARRFRGFQAPEACVRAVQAATTLPFAEGMAFERTLFLELVGSDESKALRHNFFAERQAAKVEDVPADTPLLPLAKVGIVGAGTMGGGIAMCFLSAGLPVTLVETTQEALDRGVATIRRNYENTAAKGRITSEASERAMALLRPTLALQELANCDLVIEAVFELMDVKKQVFAQLDAVVKPGAILATNTSYLDVDEIAMTTSRPEQVLGLHFFSPANVMKLLEVVRGARTAPSVLASAMRLARRIGKVAVVAGVCHGFIGNRMLAQRQAQANAIILEGARPADVDRVLVEFGFPMGPFQMGDLAGLDIGWDPATTSSLTVREVLCEHGRRGQKTGKGFYDYDGARRPTPSAEVEAIIAEFAARSGLPQRRIEDAEIRERLLYPMINEGAKILKEGIAQRSSDIDVVWLNGYGWPARTGGPMFWADHEGLANIVAGLERHADRMPGLAISPLLRGKAERGEAFDG